MILEKYFSAVLLYQRRIYGYSSRPFYSGIVSFQSCMCLAVYQKYYRLLKKFIIICSHCFSCLSIKLITAGSSNLIRIISSIEQQMNIQIVDIQEYPIITYGNGSVYISGMCNKCFRRNSLIASLLLLIQKTPKVVAATRLIIDEYSISKFLKYRNDKMFCLKDIDHKLLVLNVRMQLL